MGGGENNHVLIINNEVVPSDASIKVYFKDGSSEYIEESKEFPILSVDYIDVTLPSPIAPGTTFDYDNLLRTKISRNVYRYTVIDLNKDAFLHAYYYG